MVDEYEREQQALHNERTRDRRDRSRMDWLQGRIVDTIYLDDGKIIDVRGLSVRDAIDKAMVRWPGELEDEDAAALSAAGQPEVKP